MELTVEEYCSLKQQGIPDYEILRMFNYSENSGMTLYHWKKRNNQIFQHGKKDMPKKTDILDDHIEEIKHMRLSNYTSQEIAFKFGVKLATYEYWVKTKKKQGVLRAIPRARKKSCVN